MLSATNIVKAKLINLWVVFETVRIEGPISRSGIAEATGLSKQAASDLADELLAMRFVREQKPSGRGVGKPPTPLAINPDGAFTLGFHVDYGELTTVVMNLDGKLLYREQQSLGDLEPRGAAPILKGVADQACGFGQSEP